MGEQWIAYAVDVAPAHLWEGQRQDGWGRVKVARCGFLLDFGPTAFQWDRRPAVIDLCQLCLGSIPVEGAARTETILEEAARLVDGPRQESYGHPIDDFGRTGRIWGAMLGMDDIPPRTVAMMMVGVKLSREMNTPGRDNLVDTAGYARTAEMVTIEEERRRTPMQHILEGQHDWNNNGSPTFCNACHMAWARDADGIICPGVPTV